MPGSPLLAMLPPQLHTAVREAYRRAMAEHRAEHSAFDLALALVLENLSQDTGTARRAVAIMLANDPSVADCRLFGLDERPTELAAPHIGATGARMLPPAPGSTPAVPEPPASLEAAEGQLP